jgi:hypothetical protein
MTEASVFTVDELVIVDVLGDALVIGCVPRVVQAHAVSAMATTSEPAIIALRSVSDVSFIDNKDLVRPQKYSIFSKQQN